jgi:hypothetical protein
MKNEMGFFGGLEAWCATDELDEMWVVEISNLIVEEGCGQAEESRGIDPGHDIFQIICGPLEIKSSKGGEDSACLWR